MEFRINFGRVPKLKWVSKRDPDKWSKPFRIYQERALASFSLSKFYGSNSAVWTHPPTLRSNRGIRGRMSKLSGKKLAIKWIVCYQCYNSLCKAFWVTADWLFGNYLTRSDNNFRSSLTICLLLTKCEAYQECRDRNFGSSCGCRENRMLYHVILLRTVHYGWGIFTRIVATQELPIIRGEPTTR